MTDNSNITLTLTRITIKALTTRLRHETGNPQATLMCALCHRQIQIPDGKKAVKVHRQGNSHQPATTGNHTWQPKPRVYYHMDEPNCWESVWI